MPSDSKAGNKQVSMSKMQIKGVTMATSRGSPTLAPVTLNSQWRISVLTWT